MSGDWLGAARSAHAAERILDAAARLFAERGVAATQMADIAQEAGCSRATLYRYFDNRQAVRTAFVHREARRIGAVVADEVSEIADPGERLVEGTLTALRAVRSDPLLIAWFRSIDAVLSAEISQTSEVIQAMAAAFLPAAIAPAEERAQLARWTTRIIVSLLTMPGRDDADERGMLEKFLAPAVAGTQP
ncbi:TetR/AcrR family transcriptional regulator [Hoyosella subflava]|uniref:Putative TetR family transcriptional regulator n=1 Tax=Hoyosella subflava (strain DSM 45089 / JCM 17490 / NBRC 109087 / DQS3-9A1) TaxID=443218 RepID=F6EPK2_HOYSD|nr:TetR/AcrR family transcriptional regulator [Hoyosella subflava]AEF39435.1 Putative TetR family transcriptional regulator [Hoyosella subflava DQS3-9A1]